MDQWYVYLTGEKTGNKTSLRRIQISAASCNHGRAYIYFTESIDPQCKFSAIKCRNYRDFKEGRCFHSRDTSEMGYHAKPSDKKGSYFSYTRHSSPFCCE